MRKFLLFVKLIRPSKSTMTLIIDAFKGPIPIDRDHKGAEVLRGINSLLHSTRVVNEGYNVAKAVNFVNKSWTKHIPTGAQCTCPEQIELRKIAALFHCLEKKKTDWIHCCACEFPDWELAFFLVSSPSRHCLKFEDSAWRFFWRCATRQCVPLENSAYFFYRKT